MKERPIHFSAEMVLALLAGRKTQTRRVVVPGNSTVLGYPVSHSKRYWPHLWFQHARPHRKNVILAMMVGKPLSEVGDDVHLSVPFQHPEDPVEDDIDDMPQYRVRPIWEPGDRLWVKETVRVLGRERGDKWECCVEYRADHENRLPETPEEFRLCRELWERRLNRWTTPRFMPRWASRITLEVTDVRVQRVQEISEDDAVAEGMDGRYCWAGAARCDGSGDLVINQFWSRWDSLNAKRGFGWDANPWVWIIDFKRVD